MEISDKLLNKLPARFLALPVPVNAFIEDINEEKVIFTLMQSAGERVFNILFSEENLRQEFKSFEIVRAKPAWVISEDSYGSVVGPPGDLFTKDKIICYFNN